MKSTVPALFLVLGALSCLSSRAEILDRPSGLRIGERLTLRPYVSLSLTYDSNVGSRKDDVEGDCMWAISPALNLSYRSDSWSLLLSGYYNYRQYFESKHNTYDNNSFGQDLRLNWTNSKGGEKGWSLVLGESFKQIIMMDDMTLDNGQNYSGDSRQFQLSAALQRRFNEHWHGDINGDYYWLNYMNDSKVKGSYYGWDRWRAGAEAGFAPSRWTDILISGSYQGYSSDNAWESKGVGSDSQSFSLQGGLGSYMTDRISYRALAGWSNFEYGDGAQTDNGFVYTLSGNWKIGETWNTMLLASSYYQPSERQQASQSRVDAISWGLAKLMVRGKLRATLDLRYRRETNEYVLDTAGQGSNDYVLNIITGRIGLNYSFNRYLSAFAHAEYQRSFNDASDRRNNAYDYDRIRATIGVALSY